MVNQIKVLWRSWQSEELWILTVTGFIDNRMLNVQWQVYPESLKNYAAISKEIMMAELLAKI